MAGDGLSDDELESLEELARDLADFWGGSHGMWMERLETVVVGEADPVSVVGLAMPPKMRHMPGVWFRRLTRPLLDWAWMVKRCWRR